jgi:hypothetical protein
VQAVSPCREAAVLFSTFVRRYRVDIYVSTVPYFGFKRSPNAILRNPSSLCTARAAEEQRGAAYTHSACGAIPQHHSNIVNKFCSLWTAIKQQQQRLAVYRWLVYVVNSCVLFQSSHFCKMKALKHDDFLLSISLFVDLSTNWFTCREGTTRRLWREFTEALCQHRPWW